MNNKTMSREEVRIAIKQLTGYMNAMCNTEDANEVNTLFVNSKDLLIGVYKYNVERTGDKQ